MGPISRSLAGRSSVLILVAIGWITHSTLLAQAHGEVLHLLPAAPEVEGGDWDFTSTGEWTFMARGIHVFGPSMLGGGIMAPLIDAQDPLSLQRTTGHPRRLPNNAMVAAYDHGQPYDTTKLFSLSESGAFVWSHDLGHAGGAGFSIADLAVFPSGDFVLAGQHSPVLFVNARSFADGTSLWRRSSLSIERASSLALDATSAFVGTSGALYLPEPGSLLLRVDEFGDTAWVRKATTLTSTASALATTADGTLIAAFVIGEVPDAFSLVACLDANNGDTLWTRQLSSANGGGYAVTHCAAAPDGDVLFGGRNEGGYVLARFTVAGDPIWSRQYPHSVIRDGTPAFGISSDGDLHLAAYARDTIYLASLNGAGQGICNVAEFDLGVGNGQPFWNGAAMSVQWGDQEIGFATNVLTSAQTTYPSQELCSTGMRNGAPRAQLPLINPDGSFDLPCDELSAPTSVALCDGLGRRVPFDQVRLHDRVRIMLHEQGVFIATVAGGSSTYTFKLVR